MLANFALWFVILLITIFLGWVVTRAWRIRNVALRWLSVILSGLLTLVLAGVCVASLIGLVKFYTPAGTPAQDVTITGTPEQIQRGQHLADSFCVSCHSATGNLPMAGGVDMSKDFPLPLGSFVTVNLTPAGPLKNWTDGEILRTLREGVDRNGQKLFFMSNVNVRYMSDEDLQSIIAYLRNQPAVENPTQDPPDKPTLLAAFMSGIGLLPSGNPPVTATITAPPKAATVEYGEYLLSYQDCRGCHGADLTGGTSPFIPKGPSLRVVKGWTLEQFISTLRNGVDPSGHNLSQVMPWRDLGKLDDEELGAIYKYLVTLQ
jgi:mono/diheme cytochrome c family protein